MQQPYLEIRKTTHMGKGVFTTESIKAGTVLEISPVIVLPPKDRPVIDQTLLHDYIFEWDPEEKTSAMALGNVPVYNHSYSSNCEYEMNYDDETITITAIRSVKAGEELFINYNGDWDDKKAVWFEVQG